MNTQKLLALLVSMLLFWQAKAQPYCNIHTFTIRDGLAANTVSGIAQTPDGLMWFATWNGLCFYDGYRFMTFRNRPGEDNVLSTNRILLCKPSGTGNVWVVAYGGATYLFDTRTSHYVAVSEMIGRKFGKEALFRNVYPLANGHVWLVGAEGHASYCIEESKLDGEGEGISEVKGKALRKVELDGQGREWLFTDSDVRSADGKTRIAQRMEHVATIGGDVYMASTGRHMVKINGREAKPRTVALPAGVHRINGVAPTGKAGAVFATDGGLLFVDGKGMELRSLQGPAQPVAESKDVFADSHGRMWSFTEGGGVVLTDGATRTSRPLAIPTVQAGARTTSRLSFAHEDSHGTVWLMPAGGTFCYYDEARGQLTPYRIVADGGVATVPYVNKSFIDKDGNLWFTGYRDVTLLNFHHRRFHFHPVLAGQDARAVFTDSRGRTWVGMHQGELAAYAADGSFLGYLNRQGRLQQQQVSIDEKVYSLNEDGQGNLWIGSKGGGVYVWLADGRMLHASRGEGGDLFAPSSDDIYDIDIDRRGHVWLATFGGNVNLAEIADGRLRFHKPDNASKRFTYGNLRVRRVTHTDDGVVILSTGDGIVTFADDFKDFDDIKYHFTRYDKQDRQGLAATDALQTLVTRHHGILVVSLGGGVQRVASKDLLADGLRFEPFGETNNDVGITQSVVEDKRGDVWLMRESSIVCQKREGGMPLQYVPDVGGGILEVSEAKPFYDERLDLVTVGVGGGVLRFSPKDMTKSNVKPGIVFTGVLFQGERTMEPLLNTGRLDVASDHRNLTVYFSALEYSNRYLMRYAYKLEGVDEQWNYVEGANSASFNHLPAGRHRLLVKSTNSDGVWLDNVATLEMYVHPTFWETAWAKLLYLLLFGGLVYVCAYIYVLRTKNTMAREMGEMKTKFFTEIGHRLRTPLTLIGGPVNEVLSTEPLRPAARGHLEMVHRNAMQMLELVNKMLHYNLGDNLYISDDHIPAGQESQPAPTSPTKPEPPKPIKLLVVEDNADLRTFLVGILSADYHVLQAANGQEGLDTAVQQLPDFIITDVMMPVMDGLAMVHHIKQNNDICHIPIIILSAKASLDDRIQGLKEGVDDYITKPFSAAYLKQRVANIIAQRQMLQLSYVEQIKPEDKKTYQLESPQIVDADNEMMKRLLDYLEKHLGDTSLRIEDLAEAVNLGRSVFYGKIKSIVGMSPVDFLRHIRMQRAEELIVKSNYNFSQIAYMVGFSDPKYFTKCFKKDKGMTPSEYRERAKEGMNEE